MASTLLKVVAGMTVLSSCIHLPANAATIISLGDGDTIRVRSSLGIRTIRLACIDAPELSQQPYGHIARQALSQLLQVGQSIKLRTIAFDRYGRTVAEVITSSGQNVNMSLVKNGFAFVYRKYLSGCQKSVYLDLERQARDRRLGIWSPSLTSPMPPWLYRKNRGSSSARYRCSEIGDYIHAQQLLREGHTYLDRDGDGEACESLTH